MIDARSDKVNHGLSMLDETVRRLEELAQAFSVIGDDQMAKKLYDIRMLVLSGSIHVKRAYNDLIADLIEKV